MKKTVAIICEFNPFHNGHAYLFSRVRTLLGADTVLIAIMSGNYVQRGTPAILNNQARARSATECGADLVFELPFPYSASSAERFATAGVHIANALGCVDHLAFGSESADADALCEIAARMECDAFRRAYEEIDKEQTIGSAQKACAAYKRLYGELPDALLQPNSILGIEYIRALIRAKSGIKPIAVPRIGMPHDAEGMDADVVSASAIRRLLADGEEALAFTKLPTETRDIFVEEMHAGRAPVMYDGLLRYALLHYRLCEPRGLKKAEGLGDGLGDRFCKAAWSNATPTDFFESVRTKRYTDAYLRRAVLYGLFGVTRVDLNAPPPYTQLLAMTNNGQKVLAAIRHTAEIPILTKPADYKTLDTAARKAAELSLRADSLYCALFPFPTAPSDLLRYSPWRKK